MTDLLVTEQLGDLLLVLQVDPRLKAGPSVGGQGHGPHGRRRAVRPGQHLAQCVLEHGADGAMCSGSDVLGLSEEVVFDRQRCSQRRIMTSDICIMMRRPGLATRVGSNLVAGPNQAGRTTRQT